ncbi:hypothetical protein BHM03_00056442 [Ensete ventricosum]|uniref:Uncharacterized protein n=1 Tax=Ensete ventricosum TaxID=4639 RepID=A0A445MMD2_ENSVE|nr:hypothetical protein BHM03_00056442 [Ensete ventricosum]
MVLRMGSWPQFSVVPVNVDFRESQRGGRKDREDYRTAVRYCSIRFVVYPIMERRDIIVKLAPQDGPISTHVNGTRWLPVVGWFLLIVLTYRRGGWVGAPAGTARKSIRKRAKGDGGHTSLRGPALIVGGAPGDDEGIRPTRRDAGTAGPRRIRWVRGPRQGRAGPAAWREVKSAANGRAAAPRGRLHFDAAVAVGGRPRFFYSPIIISSIG